MKNKTTRKILTAVLLLVLAAGMLPVPAKAGTVQNAAESEVPRSAASRTAEPDRAVKGADLPGGTLPLNPDSAKSTAALPSDGARLTAVAGDTSDGNSKYAKYAQNYGLYKDTVNFKIGNRGYVTLEEAVDAAKDYDVIVLQHTIYTTGTINLTPPVSLVRSLHLTLDLNGNKICQISGDANNSAALLIGSKTTKFRPQVSVRNGWVVNTSPYGNNFTTKSVHISNVDARLNIMTYYTSASGEEKPGIAVAVEDGAKVYLYGGVYSAKYSAIYVFDRSPVYVISGVLERSAGDGSTPALLRCPYGITCINNYDGSYSDPYLNDSTNLNGIKKIIVSPPYSMQFPVYNQTRGEGYLLLETAIASARDGDRIVLQDDHSIYRNISVKKDITLDLNGRTLYGSNFSDRGVFFVSSGKQLRIESGALSFYLSSNTSSNFALVTANDKSNVILDGVNILIDSPIVLPPSYGIMTSLYPTNSSSTNISAIRQYGSSWVKLSDCRIDTPDYVVDAENRSSRTEIVSGTFTSRNKTPVFRYADLDRQLKLPDIGLNPLNWKSGRSLTVYQNPAALVRGEGYFQTFPDAVTYALSHNSGSGYTIDLLADYVMLPQEGGFLLENVSNLTIDLNGHRFTTRVSTVEKTWTTLTLTNSLVTIQNGTLSTNLTTKGGYDRTTVLSLNSSNIILRNVDIPNKEGQGSCMSLAGNSLAVIDGGTYQGGRVVANVTGSSRLRLKRGTFANATPISMFNTSNEGLVELYPGSDYVEENETGGKGGVGEKNKLKSYHDRRARCEVEYYADGNQYFIGDLIDRRFYPSLQAAVDAVDNGEIIRPIENASLDSTVTVDNGKKFTIDLDSFVLSSEANAEPMILVTDGEVALANGQFENRSGMIAETAGDAKNAMIRILSGTYLSPSHTLLAKGTNSHIIIEGESVFQSQDGKTAALAASNGGSISFGGYVLPDKDNWEENSTVTAILAMFSIGTDRYRTFEDAIAAVRNGQTLLLHYDITVSAPLRLQSNLYGYSLDLGGHTITMSNESWQGKPGMEIAQPDLPIVIAVLGLPNNRKPVTVKNGTIINETYPSNGDLAECVYVQDAILSLEGITARSESVTLFATGNSQVQVDACHLFSAKIHAAAARDTAEIQIKSGVFENDPLFYNTLYYSDNALLYPIGAFEVTEKLTGNTNRITITPVSKAVRYYLPDAKLNKETGEYENERSEPDLETALKKISALKSAYKVELLHDYTAADPLRIPANVEILDLNGYTLDAFRISEPLLQVSGNQTKPQPSPVPDNQPLPPDIVVTIVDKSEIDKPQDDKLPDNEPLDDIPLVLCNGSVDSKEGGAALLLSNRDVTLDHSSITSESKEAVLIDGFTVLSVAGSGITGSSAAVSITSPDASVQILNSDAVTELRALQNVPFLNPADEQYFHTFKGAVLIPEQWQNSSWVKISDRAFHQITIEKVEDSAATVTTSPSEQTVEGDTVFIFVDDVESEKCVEEVSVLSDGKPIAVTELEEGRYSFLMPDGDVVIKVTIDYHRITGLSFRSIDKKGAREGDILTVETTPDYLENVEYFWYSSKNKYTAEDFLYRSDRGLNTAAGLIHHTTGGGNTDRYKLSPADVGKYIYVKAVAFGLDGKSRAVAVYPTPIAADETLAVQKIYKASFETTKAIVGIPLQVNVDPDIPGVGYLWYRAEAYRGARSELIPNIPTDASSYTPTEEDIGMRIHAYAFAPGGSAAVTLDSEPVTPAHYKVTVNTGGTSTVIFYPDSDIYQDSYRMITINDSATLEVSPGDTCSLRVSISSGYHAGPDFKVSANDIPLSGDDLFFYVLEDISEDLTITVTGVEPGSAESTAPPVTPSPTPVPRQYTVTLPRGMEECMVEPTEGSTSPVTSGESFSFKLLLNIGYVKGPDFAVKANGVVLNGQNGDYIIRNITADQVVTVEGLLPKYYYVTLQEDTEIFRLRAVEGSSPKVVSGGAFSFVLLPEPATPPYQFKVTANGVELFEENGIYTIRNISEDQLVLVDNVTPINDAALPSGSDVKDRIPRTFLIRSRSGWQRNIRRTGRNG